MPPDRTVDPLEGLLNVLNKIDDAAEAGQNGSALYAADRLVQIRRLVEVAKKKLFRQDGRVCTCRLAQMGRHHDGCYLA